MHVRSRSKNRRLICNLGFVKKKASVDVFSFNFSLPTKKCMEFPHYLYLTSSVGPVVLPQKFIPLATTARQFSVLLQEFGHMIGSSLQSNKWDRRCQALKSMLQVLKGSGGLNWPNNLGTKNNAENNCGLPDYRLYLFLETRKTACCWHICYHILTYVKLFTGKYEQKTNHQLLILRLDLEGEWANGFGEGIVSGLVQQRLMDVFFLKPKIRLSIFFLQQNPGIDIIIWIH